MLRTCWAAENPPPANTQPEAKQTLAPKGLSKVVAAADDPSPERILLTLTAQPDTSQAVSWRMRPTTNPPQAAIVRAPGGPIDEKAATTLLATVEPIAYRGTQTMLFASVEFKGLQTATLYAYRVGDGQTWSEWNQFRTAADQPAPFRFLYLGDLQHGIKSQGSRLLRAAVLQAPDARFIVHAGDLVSDPFDDQQWYEWYAAAGWLYRTIPSLPSPGNHDQSGNATDQIWRPQFVLPRNGPQGQEELSYYIDYQGARLISLNGNAYDNEAQLKWLAAVLSAKPGAWTIVVMHQPLYSTGSNRDASKRREVLMPLFDQHGVDLVLQGHDHTYGRTPKIRAGRTVEAGEPGVVYATSMSGAKMYKLNPASRPFMARLAANLQLFQVVSVADTSLSYDAYTADGQHFDAFELRKNGPQATRLIDHAPKDAHPREADFYKK